MQSKRLGEVVELVRGPNRTLEANLIEIDSSDDIQMEKPAILSIIEHKILERLGRGRV